MPHLDRAIASIGWLLETLRYEAFQKWDAGRSWRLEDTYIVLEQSPALVGDRYDRLVPGLNHLAFCVATPDDVEQILLESQQHGWNLMYEDTHPYAGGPTHFAAYLLNDDGFEVELVAEDFARSATN